MRTGLVSAMIVIATAAVAQAAPAKPAGGVAYTDVRKGTAVVLYINYDTRNVTLQTSAGVLKNFTLGPAIKDVMAIKQGDTVHYEIVVSLAMYMHKESDPQSPAAAKAIALQPTGKPLIDSVAVDEVHAQILALDHTSRMVTIKVPSGDTVSFRADTSVHNLAAMKTGDNIVVRLTRALVVGITR